MRISPPPALSRIAARFQERRARAEQGERPPLTEADEANIDAFGRIVESLSNLLEHENEALRQGDIQLVASIFERKQELLNQLEIRKPVVEPFLRESLEANHRLRALIQDLSARINTNAELLSAMADAAGRIRIEVERVRERHTLRGMYDKSGHARDGQGRGKPSPFDAKI